MNGRVYRPDLFHGLAEPIMARERRKDGKDKEKHKGDDVDVVVDAVRREADDAGVEPEDEEEEHQAGQHPHHAHRPAGVAL